MLSAPNFLVRVATTCAIFYIFAPTHHHSVFLLNKFSPHRIIATAALNFSAIISCSVSCLCLLSHVSILMSPFSCLMSQVSCLTSPVSHHLSHVTCLTSPVSRPLSHVLRFLSHVSCLMYPISCISRFLSHVSCLIYPVSCILSHVSHVSCLMYHVSCLTSPALCPPMLNCFKQKQTTFTSRITPSCCQSHFLSFHAKFGSEMARKWSELATFYFCATPPAAFFSFTPLCTIFFSSRQWRGGAKNGVSSQH